MNELIDSARTAREQLAAALSALQAPQAGDLMDTVAAPVARAMGALHRIESSKGASLPEDGIAARDAVRDALAALQEVPADNPVLEEATEKVAASLGIVHELANQAKVTQMDTAQQPRSSPPGKGPKAPSPAEATARASAPAVKEKPNAGQSQAAGLDKTQVPGQAPQPRTSKSADALDRTQLAPSRPQAAPVDPLQTTQVSPHGGNQTQASRGAPQPQASQNPPRMDSKRAPMPSKGPSEGAMHVEANLGAHSATNFYKGLSGNDVVDDGGIFIETYQIPQIGTSLWIKVTLPGGYEFEASGTVRWTRESGAGDAPPGFGAAFESLSTEARQLVYRYARNREPLFHDDL